MSDDLYLKSFMIDSGAFSAWRRGEPISLKKYIRFLDKNRGYYTSAVNLDVIPGSLANPRPGQVVVEAAAEQGWKNACQMREAGLNVVPVYHMGERRYWLEKMVGEGFTYIGLSALNEATTEQKREWFDELFAYLCGTKGYPEVKTHGFGMTVLSLMYRYPWYSVDSVTYLKIGAYGGIVVPHWENGAYTYDKKPLIISTSRRSKKKWSGHAYATKMLHLMGDRSKQYVLDFIEQEGFDVEKLSMVYSERLQFNARFFRRVGELHTTPKFFNRHKGFFDCAISSHGRTTPINKKIHLLLAINIAPPTCAVLTVENCRERLMSYIIARDEPRFDVKNIMTTGLCLPPKKQQKKQLERIEL